MKFFRDLIKDVTSTGVHASTAIGNGGKRPKVDPDDEADGEADDSEAVETSAKVLKVDRRHGLVMGYAIVCQKDGQDYYDLQGDHISETEMLSAAVDFMQNSRMAKEMHDGDSVGSVVFAWPMTSDVAKAFGLAASTTGLMIAMKPTDPAVLGKFADGTYTGFSIGGKAVATDA